MAGVQPCRMQVDARVQIGLAGGEPLGERQREAGLDQHVQAPALDFRLLVLALDVCLGDLCHGVCRGDS